MKSKSSKKTLSRRVNKIERKLAQQKPEIKYIYDINTPVVLASGTTHFTIGGLAQGAGEDQRVGDRVRALNITGTVSLANSSSANEVFARVMLVRNKSNNEDVTVDTDQILFLPVADTSENRVTAQYNKTWKTRYKILYDKKAYLNRVEQNISQQFFSFSVPLNYNINYSGNTSSPEFIIDNRVTLTIILSDGVRFNSNLRMSYTDA